MPIARIIAPDGTEIDSFARPRGERARLSAKSHQIRAKRVTEDEFDLVNAYDAGTRITCDDGKPDEVWDGEQWAPASKPSAPSRAGGAA